MLNTSTCHVVYCHNLGNYPIVKHILFTEGSTLQYHNTNKVCSIYLWLFIMDVLFNDEFKIEKKIGLPKLIITLMYKY